MAFAVDGDGREEIVDGCPLERGQQQLAFFRLSEDGEFTEHLANKPALGRVHVGDIDGNGKPDFVQDLDDFVYFSDFGAYADGIMQVNLSRVPAYGEKSQGSPLFVDVDGDGVANFLRFSKDDQQFYSLGFARDSEADEVQGSVLTTSDGSNYVVVSHAVTWSPTFLSYEWDPLPNGGIGNRDTARVLDINGDGLQDVWVQPSQFVAPLDEEAGSIKWGPFTIWDGRGMVSMANSFTAAFVGFGDHPRPAHIWLNQGGTFKRVEAILDSVDGDDPEDGDCEERNDDGDCLLISTPHSFRNSMVIDYDLDGRQELVVVNSELNSRFQLVQETPNTLRFARSWLNAFAGQRKYFSLDFESDGFYEKYGSNAIWSDFDGDGNVDMVMNHLPEAEEAESDPLDIYDQLVIYPGAQAPRRPGAQAGRGRRLRRVTDGLGNQVKIDRALAREVVDMSGDCGRDESEFIRQPRCLTRLGPIIERVSFGTVDGEFFGSTSYRYAHPATADFLQGFYFTERTTKEESDGVGADGFPKVVSTTREEYVDALENSPWHDAQTYPFLRAPTLRETRLVDAPDLNGDLRARSIMDYRSYRIVGFPGDAYMDERQVRTIDETAGGEETTKTVAEVFDVDVYGLPNGYSRTVAAGNSFPTVSRFDVTTERDDDRERWILDKFDRVTVTVNGSPESFRYEHDEETGFVRQMTKLYNTDRELVTVYEPDSFGNVALMTENGARATQFSYGESGVFLQVVQNAEGHFQTFGYDDALGLQTEQRTASGYGLIHEYDGFGRLVARELDNDGTRTTDAEIAYSHASPVEVDGKAIRSKVRLTVTSDYYSGQSVKEFDSRGLLVRTLDPGLGAGGESPNLVTERTYDWAGRLTDSSQAHLVSDAPAWTHLSYDDRGRPMGVISPQGDFSYRYASHVQYADAFPDWLVDQGLELTHVTDSEGIERVLVSDEKGRSVLTAEGVDLDGGGVGLISKVIYGDWDLPARFIDPEQNETINRRTEDGLLESTEDSDRGLTEWTYDVYGNVVTESTADGVLSEFSYDKINRPRTRIDHLPDGDETTEWTYDLDVPGTLSAMTGPTGVRTEFGYEDDPRALQNLVRYTIGTETFTNETEYDSLGRVRRIVYPSVSAGTAGFDFAVRPTYDAHSGRQIGVRSDDQATDYWQVEEVDYTSQRVGIRLGNGLAEEREYDPVSRRLTDIRTRNGGDELSALSYRYYANGQMLERRFRHAGDTHLRSFTYDPALRLESVTDDGDAEEFEFSPAGRLLSRTKYGVYAYDGAQPQAVTSAGDNEFAYDERGNQYLRTGPDIPGTTQTTRKFSRFNLPVQVDVGDQAAPDETLTFEYDAAGQRMVKRAEIANVEVLTPGELYQRRGEPGGLEVGLHTYRVFVEGTEVLQVQYDQGSDAIEYRYLHRDHLGSVLYTTNEDGEQSDMRDFDVFGAALSEPSWAETTEEGFTGHKADRDLGLLEAGARMYDSTFGVFTSPDPMRVSGPGSQAFNPFAYANNDPVNWYDPTGFGGEEPETEIVVRGDRANNLSHPLRFKHREDRSVRAHS